MNAGPPHARVSGAVAIGGVIGAEARYLLGVAFPHVDGTWPWTTFWINVTGCALIGVLYTALTELTDPPPLLRPLLGGGVLGGYTTFSTWSVETVALVTGGHPVLALAYAVASPLVAVLACGLAVGVTRRVAGRPAMRTWESA